MYKIFIAALTTTALIASAAAAAPLKAIISGGISLPYNAALPDFEKESGFTVETGSGASDGTGPQTIRYQLAHGTQADIVILSRDGLAKLAEDGRIRAGSETALATVPLAAAVRTGSPKPDIATGAAFKQALIRAGQLVMSGSTSGLYMRDTILPKLALPPAVTLTLAARGSDAITALKDKKAELLLGPVSELTNQPGVEIVGLLPRDDQFVQTFAAAITKDAKNPEGADRLIRFLSSDRVTPAFRHAGMARPERR
jgi:molybdate transport system substrate-binding protein